MRIVSLLRLVTRDTRGGTAIEYGLIVSLIVIACSGAFEGVANENDGLWAIVSERVDTSMGG